MLQKILIWILLALMIFSPSGALSARSGRREKELDSKRYGKHRIIVRQVRQRSMIKGSLPSRSRVRQASRRFFKALDSLPENFVKRSGLRYVTFCENLTLRGVPAAGVASGNTIVLGVNFRDKTLYHELFHIFDKNPRQRQWTKLNHKKFVYTGSDFQSIKMSGSKRRRKEQNLASGRFDQDFVSRYAMSNEIEDRAETFAYMISEKAHFLRRTARSKVLQEKMEYIIKMTGKRKLLGNDFWDGIFSSRKNEDLR